MPFLALKPSTAHPLSPNIRDSESNQPTKLSENPGAFTLIKSETYIENRVLQAVLPKNAPESKSYLARATELWTTNPKITNNDLTLLEAVHEAQVA